MLQILVKAVFFIISGIASIILTPLLAIISTIIPNFDTVVTSMLSFVNIALTAVPFILKLLCVPIEATAFFLGYWLLIFGISLSVRAIIFVNNVYKHYKP